MGHLIETFYLSQQTIKSWSLKRKCRYQIKKSRIKFRSVSIISKSLMKIGWVVFEKSRTQNLFEKKKNSEEKGTERKQGLPFPT